jgi:hypothetical protein
MYKLHKLPEGFIVTSEEEIKPGELMYDEEGDGGLPNIRMNSDSFTYNAPGYFKVIAQQDQINFYALSEEEQKEIGWFDDECKIQICNKILENKYSQMNPLNTEPFQVGFVEGFQKALELTSDRTFTKEDLIRFIEWFDSYERSYLSYDIVEDFLSKPKSWDIEIEMGYKIGDTECNHGNSHITPSLKPKFTNGKIKITKII